MSTNYFTIRCGANHLGCRSKFIPYSKGFHRQSTREFTKNWFPGLETGCLGVPACAFSGKNCTADLRPSYEGVTIMSPVWIGIEGNVCEIMNLGNGPVV